MEDCETLDLLRLEGRYMKFIVETMSELNLLEHVEKCETCRDKVRKAMENDQHLADFGNLFEKTVEDETVPQHSDYKNPDNFMDARIQWRKRRLKQLLENAELELQDLRKRVKN
ncbi:MAG: hypothetical protein NWE89_04040 [Candidatus Bathyarchaeota archaeon]|nr:hypothetical protein [Candidatus Bathyarchaeota archaeon]